MAELTSIITPCYNAAAYLEACIESVRQQVCQDWEMIIVDDASRDNSLTIARRYQEMDPRIRVIALSANRGVVGARNAALERAKGRYIAFLDSDDRWLPSKLELQLKAVASSGAAVCYSSYYSIDAAGHRTGIFHAPAQADYWRLLRGSCIGNLTGLYDASWLGKEPFRAVGHEDYVMWLSLVKRAGRAVGIGEPLAEYRVGQGSLSGNKLRAAGWTWNIYRNVEGLPLWQAAYCFGFYAARAIFKYKRLPADQ